MTAAAPPEIIIVGAGPVGLFAALVVSGLVIARRAEKAGMAFGACFSYGITLLMRITRTMQLALEDLGSGRLELVGSGVSFEEYMRIVDLDRWSAIETRFDVEKAGPV